MIGLIGRNHLVEAETIASRNPPQSDPKRPVTNTLQVGKEY